MRNYRKRPALRKWQRTIEECEDEIHNHFMPQRSNRKVEGHNVTLKLLKQISLRIKDTELYTKRIMLGAFPIILPPQFLI